MTDAKLTKQLEVLRRTMDTRASADIIQLPLWPEPKRGTPNSFIRSALFAAIQGKDRAYLKEVTIASQEGITVKFTGMQLNQDDLTVWETLVHLAKQHPLGNICSFTAHGILSALELNKGGDEHKRLHSAILRLMACAVEIKGLSQPYAGSLLEEALGDENSPNYTVRLNRNLIKLFGETEWTAIDWQQRKLLRRKPLAQALHAYYSSHRQPFSVSLAFLQRITGSRNQQKAGFKVKLRAALKELMEIGFLQSYAIEGERVTVQRLAALTQGA